MVDVVQEYKLDDGSSVMFEVSDTTGITVDQPGTRIQVSNADDAPPGFEKALERVKPAAERLLATMSSLTSRPEAVEVSFGLKFAAGIGVIFTKASTEGNFSVKLTWKKGS